MYPQTVVPSGDPLHTTLTNGMDVENSEVTFTGDYYTANKDNLAWSDGVDEEKNPVYEYQGKRYVRVTPYEYNTNSKYHDTSATNNSGIIGQSGYRWFKVEPIKWIVLNFNEYKDKINEAIGYQTEIDTLYVPQGATLELYAADVLMSGVQFNPDTIGTEKRTLWTESVIKQYLNEVFYKEAFSSSDKSQIQVSKIFNNTSSSDYNNPIYNLNANHLTDGSGMNYTDQYLYLLSRYELENSLSPYVSTNPIFVKFDEKTADESRIVGGTDYARAHNLILSSGFTYYLTRSANSGTHVYRVLYTGGFNNGNAIATSAFYGTRPALTILCFVFINRTFLVCCFDSGCDMKF